MSYLVSMLSGLLSKELVFSLIKGVLLEVLAEPLFDYACEELDKAVESTETDLDDKLAENLKDYIAKKLEL